MASENLYVIKFSSTSPKGAAEPEYLVKLPAKFTNLQAAKKEAKALLPTLGYDTQFLSVYDINTGSQDWKHGDGILVYAEGSEKEEVLTVQIDTVPNVLHIKSETSGRLARPLHHVLQTVVEYNEDRSGSRRYTIVEGTHRHLDLARLHAVRVLLGDMKREDFAEYDEYGSNTDGPFGPDVLVHAVKGDGENVFVSVVSE
jgi:hypothetical protein